MPDSHSITSENFETLLAWLDDDAESAGEKYEHIRRRLIRIFNGRGCHEPELLADRTIDRVTSKIPQIRTSYVGDPAVYFYGVANKVYFEWLRDQKRERETVFIDLTADPTDDEKEHECLESCLEKLNRDARELILEYYRDEKSAKIERRKKLAARLGISIGALQIKASRIRSRLQDCVNDCVSKK